MKRRTLDLIFVIGGALLASVLVVLGLVLKANADFVEDYVKDNLAEQQITFKTVDRLQSNADFRTGLLKAFEGDQAAVDRLIADYHLAAEADTPCLVKYAGQTVTTGKQAECYADTIRSNLRARFGIYAAKLSADPARRVPQHYTYATFGPIVSELRNLAAEAKTNNDPRADEYQASYQAAYDLRVEYLSRGELERGMLLTTYGFSQLGDKSATASLICFVLAAILALASIAGLIHAVTTPETEVVGHSQGAERPGRLGLARR